MAETIDEIAFENDPSVAFLLDREYRLRACNAAWDRFALENDGKHLLRDSVTGQSVFEYISGMLADYYRRVFDTTLRSGSIWQQEYECSSASVHRRFSM